MTRLRRALDLGLAYPIITVFTLVSAGVMLLCTIYGPMDTEHLTRKVPCLERGHFGMHLLYVIQLCTTVGYGNLDSCTWPGKVCTIIISMLGLPLIVYIVMDAGNRMERYSRVVYGRIKHVKSTRARRKSAVFNGAGVSILKTESTMPLAPKSPRLASEGITTALPLRSSTKLTRHTHSPTAISINPQNCTDDELDDMFYDLPIWLPVAIFIICVLICATYYYFVEQFSVGISLYRAALIFFAGDFYVQRHSPAIPVYLVIFVGFSMLSMSVNTIMGNLKNLIERVKIEVQREIDQATLNPDGTLDVPRMDELMNRILRKHSAHSALRMLVSDRKLQEVHDLCVESVNTKQETLNLKAKLAESAKIDKQCESTASTLTFNASTSTHEPKTCKHAQTGTIKTVETLSQTNSSSLEKAVYHKPETENFSCSTKPETQTVATQEDMGGLESAKSSPQIYHRADVRKRRGIWDTPFVYRDNSPSQ